MSTKQNPTSTLADQMRVRLGERGLRSTPIVAEDLCRDFIQSRLPHGETLPATQSFFLFLIRCFSEAIVDGKPTMAVAFAPEFLFVLDFGYDDFAGVSVTWSPPTIGLGDAAFPDFSTASLRSVENLSKSRLIFPAVAGDLIIKVKDGTPNEEVIERLTKAGLIDVENLILTYYLAKCHPFKEKSTAAHLQATLPFVENVDQNHVVRIIDISPGWDVMRLA
jgi:hypothetical protein